MDREKLKPLPVKLPESLYAALRARAEGEDRTMAGIIRQALRAYLEAA